MTNSYLISKVNDFILKNQLIHPDSSTVVVGVSGGCDSVVLLDILIKSGFECIVAHCNFNLRSTESKRDERFVRKLAKSYDLPYLNADFKTLEYSKKHKISIEMAARELRYEWFEKVRVLTNSQAIAVGHHQDDNIESILLNFARGTGLKGMIGMPMRNGYVIRPLLGSSRNEIKEYAINNKLKFVEDSSNFLTEYKRNKIRLTLIPLFEELNSGFCHRIIETRNNMEDAYRFVSDEMTKIKQDIIKTDAEKLYIDIEYIAKHPHQRLILFETLHPYGFNSNQLLDILSSWNAESGKIFYSKTHELLKDRTQWLLREISAPASDDDPAKSELLMPNIEVQIVARSADFDIVGNESMIMVDADKLHFPYNIRRWQSSDFFYPLGMNFKKKKISDLLIDRKIDRFSKEEVWLLVSSNEIVWVIGIQSDERFKVTDNTRSIAILKLKN